MPTCSTLRDYNFCYNATASRTSAVTIISLRCHIYSNQSNSNLIDHPLLIELMIQREPPISSRFVSGALPVTSIKRALPTTHLTFTVRLCRMAFASDLDSSAIIRIPKTLSLTPVKPTRGIATFRICYWRFNELDAVELPQMEELIRDGESILDASMSWKRGKTFGDVETFFCTTVEDSRRWYCRVSQHREEDISFEQFWEKLGRNKILNEQR